MNISDDLTYIRHHIILLIIVVGLAFGGIYGVESLVARHDAANASQTALILKQQQQQVASLESQLQSNEQQWQKVETQLLVENTQLAQTIAQRNTQLAVVQKQNATLTAQEAAQQLTVQTKAQPNEVTAQGSTVILDLPIARTLVSDLDSIQVLQANLSDTQTQLKNETQIASNSQANVKEQAVVITNLQTENKDEIIACTTQIAAIKATNRKDKIKVFLKGFVAGTVFGVIGKRMITGSW